MIRPHLVLPFLLCLSLPAQQPPDQADLPITTLTLGTRLVNVAALVRDKHGKPISGLKQQDFSLEEDGKPVPIAFFSEGSDLPLTLALMVDTSGSQRSFIADETKASQRFFPAMLTRPQDRATLVKFDNNVLRLQGMTNSVPALITALDKLSDPHDSSLGGRGGTLLYDAICGVSSSLLDRQQGRRAMVLLTDGGDNGSLHTYTQAVACALAFDVVVYSVFYSEERSSNYGRIVLEGLSKATGGSVFTVSHSHSLETIYAEIANDMRLQYQIAYHPPPSAPRTFHKIDVKTGDPKLKVQARAAYYTPATKP